MFDDISIAPSILSANFMNLEHDISEIEQAGAAYVHVDVMDGHFVPNITIGVPLVKQLSRITDMPLDVHLMVENPLQQIPWFIRSGAQMITVHAETLDEKGIAEAISLIHQSGCQACVALKPQTPIDLLKPHIKFLDMVLVMSVEPGFSGQSYIAGSENKVVQVVSLAREANKNDLAIEVDGGIDEYTARRVCEAGADVLVCGNAVFGMPDIQKAVKDIASAATSTS